jgi:predicted Zn-ribbon and HTH transcriptional regulator
VKINKKRCKRCAHEWVTRIERDPLKCPRCQSQNWKTGKLKKVRRAA